MEKVCPVCGKEYIKVLLTDEAGAEISKGKRIYGEIIHSEEPLLGGIFTLNRVVCFIEKKRDWKLLKYCR